MRFHFDGRLSLHMCGRSDHLLEIFRDDLAVHELQGFGYEVDLDRIAGVLGGRVVLLGNVNPMLIHAGTPDRGPGRDPPRPRETWPRWAGSSFRTATTSPPGSPLANINAMMEAAEEWGRPSAPGRATS